MIRSLLHIVLISATLSISLSIQARTDAQGVDQTVYTDSLQNGWQNWGWATLNYSNTSPIHGGTDSISVTAGPWQAIFLHHSVQDAYQYSAISFWVNGGPTGGQKLQISAQLSQVAQSPVPLATLSANTWQHVTVSLASLGVAGKPDFDGFWIMDATGTAQPTFYLDDISLLAATTPPPTSANLQIDAGSALRTVDPRLFGVNTAVWDSNMSTPATSTLLGAIGTQAMRFPGGSTSDSYDWSKNLSDGSSTPWGADTGRFADLAATLKSQAYMTVNYGSGSPQMAAAWVAWANASTSSTTSIGIDFNGRNWLTAGYWASLRAAAPLTVDDGLNFLRRGHQSPYGLHYWEIGNEVYGSWENDLHGVTGSGLPGVAHDAVTYGNAVVAFAQLMHSVDPTVKIGVVVTGDEDSYAGSLGITDANEGNKIHYGWTPELLATLKGLNYAPDFLSYHRYAQAPWMEDDYVLLQSTAGWKSDAIAIRKMLTDYLGTAGSNVEIAATEAGSVSSTPGKQSTSLVDGLFYADSAGDIAETEINSNIWWDLRNGSDPNENNSSTLYGWREFGDYGMVASGDRTDTPLNTPYPVYYGAKLVRKWAAGGDSVVSATTDYARLVAHAVLKADGHLALLVVNKSPSTDLTGHIALNGFSTVGPATVYSYGKANDTNNTDITQSTAQVGGSNFDYVFPSYSMTVLDLPYGHTVSAGLQMISAPFDYTGTALSSLLGTGAKLYVWAPSNFTYDVTPTAPADTLHLGAGYWVKLSSNVTVTTAGTPAPTGTPFRIALQTGWNMIGDPFPSSVTIGNIAVDTPTPSTPVSITKSSLVRLPLYAYNGSEYVGKFATDTLDPYSGYWIYATQPATLLITAP